MNQAKPISPATARALTSLFRRNGCVRRQSAARHAKEGSMQYKKGDEIRLVASSDAERDRILQLLKRANFKAGRPFRKHGRPGRSCVPIYGRNQVALFLAMVADSESPPSTPPRRVVPRRN